MQKPKQLALACLTLLMTCSAAAQEPNLEQLRQQVENTERAFAKSMADRDHDAFTSFLSGETVFFSGDTPLRGKQQVADTWKPYFDGPDAPFSWEPELVVVLDSGTLALSSGPVRNPSGQRVATFNSIWRLEPSGQWRIVFDKGSRDCPDPAAADGG
ncbi:YybH family protein [Pseudomonadota bacterium]|jgi:ketosteroid isomerase-like protein|nr:nuclear transport factor 2 family protein [Xanthomonadales bacterium]